MPRTIDEITLGKSRLADRKEYASPGQGSVPGPNAVSLANVISDDGTARPYRIFLGRLDRRDQHAPLNPGAADPFQSVPAWRSQQFSYTAGIQQLPLVPPRRSNPIWGLNVPANLADLTPTPFVEIVWGLNTAFPQRMIAHWPVQGASIVVPASYIQVFAGCALYNAGTGEFVPVVVPEEWPVFQAQITPDSGHSPKDASELSLTQRIAVLPFTAAIPAVPGLVETVNGWDDFAPGAPNPMAVGPVGGPFADAAMAIEDPTGTFTRIQFQYSEGFSGSIVVTALPGGVANVQIAGPPTFGPDARTVQKVIDGLAAIGLTMTTAMNPADQLKATAGANETWGVTPGDPAINFAGFAPAVPLRWGGAVYVPDFARRVRVVLTEQPECEGEAVLPEDTDVPMVPFAGDPIANVVWFDDTGAVIDAAIQGRGVSYPVQWHPVPAGATMLGVYTKEGVCGECPDGVTINYSVAVLPEPGFTITYEDCVLEIVQSQDLPTIGQLEEALAAVGWTYNSGLPPETLLSPANEVDGPFTGSAECEGGSVTVPWATVVTGGGSPPSYNDDPNIPLPGSMAGPCGPEAVTYTGLIHWRISP